MILNLAFYILTQAAINAEIILPVRPEIKIILADKKKQLLR